MEQFGVVVHKNKRDRAQVQFRRHSACNKCGQCSGPEERVGEVVDPIGVEKGEWVLVRLEGRTLVGAAFTVYILPLLGLLLGYFLVYRITGEEGWAVAGGLGALAVSFVLLRFWDTRLGQKGGVLPHILRRARPQEIEEHTTGE